MTKQLPLSGQSGGSIPFAPEGWRFMIPTAIIMLIGWALGWAEISGVVFILLLFMLNFFRNPERVNCGIPNDYTLNEKLGERVGAGLTVIAQKYDIDEQANA